MSKITFFTDTEPSSLNTLKAKPNNCRVAEGKGLYIKHQTLVCGSRGHSITCSPWERLLGWVPSTSQGEKHWAEGRRTRVSLPLDKVPTALAVANTSPKNLSSFFSCLSRHCFLSISLPKTQDLNQQLWSRGTRAGVYFNVEHRYPSLHASEQLPSSNPSFWFAHKKA